MKYTHLIFDWDGTIANTKRLWIASYKQLLLENYSLAISEQDIAVKAYGVADGVTSFGISDYLSFNRELFNLVKMSFYKSPLFPGIKEVLNRLKIKYELLIATSTERRMLQESLEFHELTDLFSHVVAREDVSEQKPSPQAINIIINKHNCEPTSTVIIGDSDKDIVAGKRAGINTVLFLSKQNMKYDKREANKLLSLNPDFVIQNHKKLLTIFPN